ncbi:Coiled-coil domain-containing protein 50 [Chionoecetes opilio]|uniref:Coiled-coil domain-containing protein 50 n=1 Tax=Chionoecetes opilio TaxID=41210 RepID=A0A8J5CF94_CHIOP|nr:Coiled-coil domain-containing protein 50 [Chionoecetes opilio]
MAEFQVHAMADGNTPDDLPQRGRVTEVCREWLMHEDQALAHRLQNEEYQTHLLTNRERNQLLRQDTPRAREEQIREDHEAAMAQTAFELSLARQEARDADLAANLSLQLNVKELEKKHQQEEEDMMYARSIMEREKDTVRQVRELRQVEREAAYLGINTGSDNVALLSRKERRREMVGQGTSVHGTVRTHAFPCTSREHSASQGATSEGSAPATASSSGVSSDLSDLSDFCLQPTNDMDEEEQRVLQEDQDAELARLLQEQDGKRRGDLLHEDQLLAIEAQDRELAKVLQEQERAKAKKAREKARQKALKKKQTDGKAPPPDSSRGATGYSPQEIRCTGSPLQSLPVDSNAPGPSGYPSHDSPGPPDYGGSSPTYMSPESPRQDMDQHWHPPPQGMRLQRPDSLDLPGSSQSTSAFIHQEPSRNPHHNYSVGRTNKARLPDPERAPGEVFGESTSSSSIEPSPGMGFTNIACAIDPTYQRRVMRGELAPSPQATLQSSSSSSTTSSGTGGLVGASISSPISPLPPPVFDDDDDDDDYPVPPYMPIQGQRRTASLEKKRRLKPPKEKSNSKDGCKQQ